MKTVNIREAKTHLSKIIAEVIQGETFIIAKAGKPLVKLTALTEQEKRKKNRIGFMSDQIKVPDDFDQMGRDEIDNLFLLNTVKL
jgi:prevent-host-death family protein